MCSAINKFFEKKCKTASSLSVPHTASNAQQPLGEAARSGQGGTAFVLWRRRERRTDRIAAAIGWPTGKGVSIERVFFLSTACHSFALVARLARVRSLLTRRCERQWEGTPRSRIGNGNRWVEGGRGGPFRAQLFFLLGFVWFLIVCAGSPVEAHGVCLAAWEAMKC